MPRLWRHRDGHTSLLDLAGRSRPAFFCLRLGKGMKPLRKICVIGAWGSVAKLCQKSRVTVAPLRDAS